jgi:hypothetical protein
MPQSLERLPNMLPMQTALIPVSAVRVEAAPAVPTDAVKDIILQRMALRESPWRIAAYLQAELRIEIDSDQVLACWNACNASPTRPGPTQTGPRQEKDSMPIPTSAVKEPIAQRMALGAPSAPTIEALPATLAARIDRAPVVAEQAEESCEALTTEMREFIIERMARNHPPTLIAEHVKKKFGLVVDRDEIIVCWRDRDALPTQTGPRQEKESMPILNDEIKEFIVKRIACYETPSRIAAAVRINFGIDVDRRQVFEYNPSGSRPPAQRWIDLHAATRARFLRETADIGIAQKTMRLRMLDRFAQLAEENDRIDKAAKFLEQAARECGGFYDKLRAPAQAARDSTSESIPTA